MGEGVNSRPLLSRGENKYLELNILKIGRKLCLTIYGVSVETRRDTKVLCFGLQILEPSVLYAPSDIFCLSYQFKILPPYACLFAFFILSFLGLLSISHHPFLIGIFSQLTLANNGRGGGEGAGVSGIALAETQGEKKHKRQRGRGFFPASLAGVADDSTTKLIPGLMSSSSCVIPGCWSMQAATNSRIATFTRMSSSGLSSRATNSSFTAGAAADKQASTLTSGGAEAAVSSSTAAAPPPSMRPAIAASRWMAAIASGGLWKK
jgi:hypothetical protein